jgi:hypothetical protein
MPTEHTDTLLLPYPSSGADLVAEGDDVMRELAERLEVVIGPPAGPAGGDLGGAYPAPTVVLINGRAVSAVVFTDDARLTNSRSPTGAAGGDLAGSTYPNPVVATINGRAKTAVVFTDDARLADARSPTAHAASHRVGGSDPLAVVAASAVQVRDVGEVGQIRAGRVLTPADFTAMGLAAPAGLWNLGDSGNVLTDGSGNNRDLGNKGAVARATGIGGAVDSAAQFTGSTAQALYRTDAGAGDAFRIRTGSWGCWFRTARRGTSQWILAKDAATSRGWGLFINSANVLGGEVSTDGAGMQVTTGASDVCDERWHHAVVTFDGALLLLYVDGALEVTSAVAGLISPSSGPLNVGARRADPSTAADTPHYGRVDEAFVTADVLSADQVRNLYAARITHALAVTPTAVRLAVRRRRRGGPLAVADFPAPPVRLHSFTGGSLADAGLNNQALANNGAAPSVAGADGGAAGAIQLAASSSQYLSATDAGLPAGTASRSMGLWFKGPPRGVQQALLRYGSTPFQIYTTSSDLIAVSDNTNTITGPTVQDDEWRFVVVTVDNAPVDGVKIKFYVDGGLLGGSTALASVALAGAGGFTIGRGIATDHVNGAVDSVFVCDYALTPEQVRALYNVGSQALAPSPKDAGAHVEALEAASLLAVFDTLNGCDQIDLQVAA